MVIDVSVQVAWAIANAEAFFSGHDRIEPIHFFLGILKTIDPVFEKRLAEFDLPEKQILKFRKNSVSVRHYLEMSPKELTVFRRQIRSKVRSGRTKVPVMDQIPHLHRSDFSRALFASMIEHAVQSGQNELTVMLLMEAIIQSGAVDLDGRWKSQSHYPVPDHSSHSIPLAEAGLPPILNGYGNNLNHLNDKGDLKHVIGREDEIAKLARSLHHKSNLSSFLGERHTDRTN